METSFPRVLVSTGESADASPRLISADELSRTSLRCCPRLPIPFADLCGPYGCSGLDGPYGCSDGPAHTLVSMDHKDGTVSMDHTAVPARRVPPSYSCRVQPQWSACRRRLHGLQFNCRLILPIPIKQKMKAVSRTVSKTWLRLPRHGSGCEDIASNRSCLEQKLSQIMTSLTSSISTARPQQNRSCLEQKLSPIMTSLTASISTARPQMADSG